MNSQFSRRVACPICFMPVDTANCEHTAEYGGGVYFFCGQGCRERYLNRKSCCGRKKKSAWGRFLDRLASANQKEFGDSGPKCH